MSNAARRIHKNTIKLYAITGAWSIWKVSGGETHQSIIVDVLS